MFILSVNPRSPFLNHLIVVILIFAQTVDKQVIQGNVQNNGMSTVRLERKGDLLGYIYLAPVLANGTQHADIACVG